MTILVSSAKRTGLDLLDMVLGKSFIYNRNQCLKSIPQICMNSDIEEPENIVTASC
jgi:hypothetical protein